MPDEKMTENDFHKKYAAACFNKTWDLMDKEDRTIDEDIEMIHTAHASAFHWSKIGEPLHFERGEWQISRVYSILNKPTEALYHAQKCLDICKENDIVDFDLAFAYEAMARGYSIVKDSKKKDEFIKLAKEASKNIKKKEDKEYFLSELGSIL